MNRGRHKKSKEKGFNTQNEATVKDGIYTIKFEFGDNSKIFKYKHEQKRLKRFY